MTDEEVLKFIDTNKFEVTDANTKTSRCIDGRYEDSTAMPALAKPGADAGDLMIAFAALNSLGVDVENQQVLKLALDNIGGPQKFSFHTDTHQETDTPGLGCGHLKQSKLDPKSYGLKKDQIEFIFSSLPKLIESGANQANLEGTHQEQMVLIINSEKYSVKPLSKTDGGDLQAFVYHQTLDSKRQETLASALSKNFSSEGVSTSEILEAVQNAAQKQLGETAKRLAGSLPVHTISISDEGDISINA